jgi:MFS family permease
MSIQEETPPASSIILEENKPSTANRFKYGLTVPLGSVIACLTSVLLLRIASRTSYVVLGFYLGANFESAALVVIVIDAFYISELLLAQVMGSLSDRKGRKPFMLWAPVIGAIAAAFLWLGAVLFPKPDTNVIDLQLIALLLIILSGRLLEGAATAFNVPANLGYLTDATMGSETVRARVMTLYEVATVAGIAMAIPFGGQVSKFLGVGGFGVVIFIYALCYITIAFFMRESLSHDEQSQSHHSIMEGLAVIKDKRIWTFVPAWTAVMALIGAWLALIIIILAYPTIGNYRLVDDPKLKQYTDGVSLQSPVYTEGKVTVNALRDGQLVRSFELTTNPEERIVVTVIENGRVVTTHDTGDRDNNLRFPNQLLHGGFQKDTATLLVGAYGFIFILGMGLWMLVYKYFRRTTMMLIGLAATTVTCAIMMVFNGFADSPYKIKPETIPTMWVFLIIMALGVILLSGFTPAALTHLAAISETLPGKRGAVMGLYSVLLGIGQFVGTILGGFAADIAGYNGLMIYSLILCGISFLSVLYMRTHNHDLIGHGKGH